MSFSMPSFSWDRDDWGDLPGGRKVDTGFTGDNMPRDPGTGGPTVRDASRAGSSDVIVPADYSVYWYDSDTDNTGGIKVGAGEGDTIILGSPGDFDIQMGDETLTVPGSEQAASENQTYHIYWVEGDASISISTTKADAVGKDRIYLGRITTGNDITDGSATPSDDPDTTTDGPKLK